MKQLPISGTGAGNFLVVDDIDYDRMKDIKWFLNSGGYASGSYQGKKYLAHRFVMNAPKGITVDHVNRNRLDCRRSNRPGKKGSSKYKGVAWVERDKRWLAHIRIDYKKKNLGYYVVEEDAARAYDQAARLQWGDFAVVNFPTDDG